MRCVELFGVKLNLVKRDELLKICELTLDEGKPIRLFAINPIKISKSHSNEKLRKILNGGDINFCDGKGVCYALKILCGEKIERFPGFELLFCLLEIANRKEKSVFFIGNREESIKKGIEKLKKKYPDVKFMGYLNGYFKKEELDVLIEKFKKNPPDILFVGMGAFLQEKWIIYITERVKIPISIGIGGSVDVISGFSPRAPKFLCDIGLEWLYRLIRQPKRIKVMIHLPIFAFMVFKEKIRRRKVKC